MTQGASDAAGGAADATGAAPAKGRAKSETSFWTRHQTLINFWLDTALLVNFLGLAWVAVIVQFIFPPAESSNGFTLWGLRLSQWMEVQFALLALLFLGIVVHLMLHWTWVCNVLSRKILHSAKKHMDDGQRTILGVGLMIVCLNIMGLAIAAAALTIQAPV